MLCIIHFLYGSEIFTFCLVLDGFRSIYNFFVFHRYLVTINSCYFKLIGKKVARLPAFRGKGFVKSKDNPIPTGSSMKEHRGALRGQFRVNFENCYLKTHANTIRASRRSMKKLGLNPLPAAVPRLLAVREWTLRSALPGVEFEKILPTPPSKHSVGGCPPGWKLRPTSWVQKNYPERFDLVKHSQVDVWLDGKESHRDEIGSSREWADWWSDVRVTGFSLPERKMRVGVTGTKDGQCAFIERNPAARLYKTNETRFWLSRLKAKQIGPYLRDLQQKKSVDAVSELLVPDTWRPRMVPFRTYGTPFSKVFRDWMFSFKNIC